MSRIDQPSVHRRAPAPATPFGAAPMCCRGWLLAVTLVVALACAGPAAPAPPPVAPQSAPASANPAAPPPAAPTASAALAPAVKVRLGVLGIAPEAGLFIALDKGYFQAEGLDVEEVPLQAGGGDQFVMLTNNEIHFATAAPEPAFFNGIARGVPLKIVAPYTISGPGANRAAAGVVVRKDLVDSGRWQEPKDFKGLTFAWSGQGGVPQMYVERALALGGLALDDVTPAPLSFPDILAAVLNGNVDAGWQVEPFITIGSQRQASVLAVKSGDLASGLISVTLVMGLPFAAQQPEAARRFVTAWLKGAREQWQAFDRNGPNQEEVIEILTRHTPIKDPNTYRALAATGATLGTGPVQNADLPASGLEPFQDYFLKARSVRQKVDIDQLIDRSYAQAALERLGRLE